MCSGMCLRVCPAVGTSPQLKSNLLFSGDTDIENRLMDTGVVGRKERVGWMERVTWKHTLSYVR